MLFSMHATVYAKINKASCDLLSVELALHCSKLILW